MSAPSSSKITDISQPASNQETDSGTSHSQAGVKDSVFAQSTDSLDVFSQLVETPDDFLGMLAYSLYKRHKIEWLQAHPQDNHQAFKKVACTPQQIGMYRSQAEQMAKNFIDITLEALGEEMRGTIMTNEVMTRMNQIEPNLSGKIDQLKPPFYKVIGNHFLGGVCSAIVAVTIFGFFTLYSKFQNDGGLEGMFKGDNQQTASVETEPRPAVPPLEAKK
ncbi:hypothetical protein G7009_05945 [Pseudomonas capeferrum]|uniref:hypothetical protein n=1 Tax=Pseudomonas TaxID=286 RepID=UPI00112393A3|nr:MULTISPECIES: hypothetical protein [Pseudomonas]ELU0814882.1 hypothetical protein [Pseudomonas putida]MBA1201310.1 hypothetical protein [Pseudomonas capeferrum]